MPCVVMQRTMKTSRPQSLPYRWPWQYINSAIRNSTGRRGTMTTDASESSRRPSYSGDHVSNTLICAFCRTYDLCGRSYGIRGRPPAVEQSSHGRTLLQARVMSYPSAACQFSGGSCMREIEPAMREEHEIWKYVISCLVILYMKFGRVQLQSSDFMNVWYFRKVEKHLFRGCRVDSAIDAARCVDVNHRPVGNPKRKVWWAQQQVFPSVRNQGLLNPRKSQTPEGDAG
jgi:hypothetical protein